LIRCSRWKCCKQYIYDQVRGHHDKMALTKTNTSNDTKHVQHHDATEIQTDYIFVFFVMVRYQICWPKTQNTFRKHCHCITFLFLFALQSDTETSYFILYFKFLFKITRMITDKKEKIALAWLVILLWMTFIVRFIQETTFANFIQV